MHTFHRAAIVAAALSLLLAGATLAKGEAFAATIGPIDGITPGTPSDVTVQVTVDGHRVAPGDAPVYLAFTDFATSDLVEFSLHWDAAKATSVATVVLPHEGRWSVNALLRFDALHAEQIGMVDGSRTITVPAAPVAPPAPTLATSTAVPAASPVVPLLAGAVGASLAWLTGIGAFALRRRRRVAAAQPGSITEQMSA